MSWAGGGSLVTGQGWERQITAVPGKKGALEAAVCPHLRIQLWPRERQ